MKESLELLAEAVEKIKLSNPPHCFNLPMGCTRAEAERLTEEAQEAHPWQKLFVGRFISPGDAYYDYDKKQWVGDMRYNSETGKNESVYPDDPPPAE